MCPDCNGEWGNVEATSSDATPTLISWLRHKQKEGFVRQRLRPGDEEQYEEAVHQRLERMALWIIGVAVIAAMMVAFAVFQRACR